MLFFPRNQSRVAAAYGVAVVLFISAPLTGCTEQPPASEGPTCGDTQCTEGELLAGCSADCLKDVRAIDADLDSCATDLEVATIEEELRFSLELARSLGAIDEGARRSATFSDDFVNVLPNLAYDPTGDVLSLPMQFDGEAYTMALTSTGGADLTARIFFGEDYEAGAKGDLITIYPFKADAYFVNPEVDIVDWGAIVGFDGVGPLVELVGKGPSPESPVEISLFNAADETSIQELEETIAVDERRPGDVRVAFEATARRKMLVDGGGLTPLALTSFEATGGTGATATVDEWNVRVEHPTAATPRLTGNVDLSISGGALPPHITSIVYDTSSQPEVFIRCK